MGYTPVFKQINWDEKDALLEAGTVDCLWGSFSMNGREEKYLWAGPYMYSRQVVAVLKDSDIQTLSDLKNKRIAVQISSKPEEIFSKRTNDQIPKVKNIYCLLDMDEVVSALRKDYVDAWGLLSLFGRGFDTLRPGCCLFCNRRIPIARSSERNIDRNARGRYRSENLGILWIRHRKSPWGDC